MTSTTLPRPRRRPGRPPGGELLADRTTLLEAAERAIAAEGPDVTMEAIAAEASVSKPILYRMIGDRDALIAELSDRFTDRAAAAGAAAAGAAATNGAVSLRAATRALIGSFVDLVAAESNLFLFVTAGPIRGDRLDGRLTAGDRSAIPLAAQLAQPPPIGFGLSPPAALVRAHGIIGALHYATLWWLRDRSCTADELADQLTELLWHGRDAE
jgi:AcrR family transcriptional regulator